MRFTVVLRDADFDKSAHAKVRGHYSIKQVKSLAANAFSLSADSMVRVPMWTFLWPTRVCGCASVSDSGGGCFVFSEWH